MEDNNVARGLGSRQDNKTGDDRMYSLQGETGSNEPVASQDEREGQDSAINNIKWFVWIAACGYLAILFYQLWQDELVYMQTLNTGVKIMRAIARNAGACALKWEASYNEYVNTLH